MAEISGQRNVRLQRRPRAVAGGAPRAGAIEICAGSAKEYEGAWT
jgi:hypothetical protein